MSKVILITEATTGFGKIWTEAFLKRGDIIIATGRAIEDRLKSFEQWKGVSEAAHGIYS